MIPGSSKDGKETRMTGPLIFIFTNAIKEGKLAEYQVFNQDFVEFLKAKEPRLIAYEVYVNEDGSEATSVLFHPDADSEDFHMQVAGERLSQGYEFIDLTRMTIEVYGTPSDAVLEQLKGLGESGVPVKIKAHVGGFTRSTVE
jgi:hypothetical protein